MTFVVKKLPTADQDALDAALWHDEREEGLGDDFLDDADAAVQRLTRYALIHRVRFADVRRAPVRRFKFYDVYYLVREREVWVIAIEHGRRHPRHLQVRRPRKVTGQSRSTSGASSPSNRGSALPSKRPPVQSHSCTR